ncbi:peptidyl-tRNA hydrolase [Rhodococcoides kroppenstedtii]|uniref:peptidyl-tRNA hydrolase n=1 Tax=Rhodococcoides kroppenstedtii TaxID=293050 RepID=UPI00169FFE7A|nr:hypothetical protein [Rhodococcus kroppenstedtii]
MTEPHRDPETGPGPEPEPATEPDTSLTDRHAALVRMADGADRFGSRRDPDDPGDVRAMPMVLHIPKAEPPARSALLRAAATATALVCLDPRVGPDGPWHGEYTAWLDARIRKVSRRARGAQWTAAQEVDGITTTVDGASARVYVPCRLRDLDPRLRKLQVEGTDLPFDDRADASDPDALVLWVNGTLDMTVGKTAAQVGHAVMLAAGRLPFETVDRWFGRGCPTDVRIADAARWAESTALGDAVVGVRDAGYTEVAPGSTTVLADLRSIT